MQPRCAPEGSRRKRNAEATDAGEPRSPAAQHPGGRAAARLAHVIEQLWRGPIGTNQSVRGPPACTPSCPELPRPVPLLVKKPPTPPSASSLLLSTIHLTFFSVETICIRTTVLSCTEYIRCSTFCFIYRGRRTSRSSCCTPDQVTTSSPPAVFVLRASCIALPTERRHICKLLPGFLKSCEAVCAT